ncbi:glutamate synthase (NADPH), homotetrameric [candidate division WOR-3 bacterium]|uniref:Glutamate synthase (NADPH), homotetrameric n=1 Tax=candidate division WOR-3 bacterium TaxID=2052148 RepID=A0A660SK41_UNCW3|nr:MAG: glutamate synthase (NADPH), homotetrameric [candidate division WOR-3 bacterium]
MAKLDLNRRPMPKQDPKERIKNFNEVALGYTPELAIAEAKRCLECKRPLCVKGCPVEIDIPGFIKLVAAGRFLDAVRLIKKKNTLPAICGRVCPQEVQCEKTCILNKKGAPIAIGRLERFVADYEAEVGKVTIPKIEKKTGKKVAVVGSGPAGLTVASDLIQLGHDVTIFEALHKPGGVLVYGIPEFRLPKRIVDREVDYIKKLGVRVVLNFVVGMTMTVDEILKEYDAVFIGSGAGLPWFMSIPGETLNGVYSANEYLTRTNLMKAYLFPEYDTPIKIGRRVAVIGGGNVAMDAARTALRLGADEVIVIYRRSRAEMPARVEEVENAEEEGVKFQFLTNPVRYISDDHNQLVAVECLRMRLGEPDASGRRRPIPIEGSEFVIPIDVCVVAIGNSPNPLIPKTTPGLETGKWGNIIIDEATGKTKKERVWAGGDVVTGAATVILAMGAGRIAARSIDEFLRTGKW